VRLPLAFYGDPILRKKAAPIKEITNEIRQLAQDMIDTVVAEHGVGLAGPQVHQSLTIFITVDYVEQEDGKWACENPRVYLNPKILSRSEELETDEEGCLSIPDLRASVARPVKIEIEAMDLEGKIFKEELHGFNARRFMHENDHVNGVLFIDRIRGKERKELEGALRQIKKDYYLKVKK